MSSSSSPTASSRRAPRRSPASSASSSPTRRDRTVSLHSCARAWRINGFPATIHIWTEETWRRMKTPPEDAQYFDGCGVWAALRMDEEPDEDD